MRGWRYLGSAGLLVPLFAGAVFARGDSIVEYVEVRSESLGKEIPVGVYLPDGYDGGEARYPVLYFLHGMFGDERKWENRGVPEQLDELIESDRVSPMIVVCPRGENSFYVNWLSGRADWEDFVVTDLVAAIDGKYRTRAEPRFRAISGDSMGGFGALNIAFRNPAVYGSVSAHSAALYSEDPADLPGWTQRYAERWKPVWGHPIDEEFGLANNPLHEARTMEAQSLGALGIYFDCGKVDRYGFDQGNQRLHEILDEREVVHEFHLHDGDHGSEYFRRYVGKSLTFHGARFLAATSDDQDD